MRPKYEGIKFYSANDLSVGYEFKKAVPIIDGFANDKVYTDVNEVIELYNIQRLIDSGVHFKSWDETTISEYKRICKQFTKTIAIFFAGINDSNFLDVCHSVSIGYVEDFWVLIEKYKTYKDISEKVFAEYLNDPETTIEILIQHKDIVQHYDEVFANCMRKSEQSARLIISKFLEKHDRESKRYFPNSLHPEEYEPILNEYVNSQEANLNSLQRIASAQNTKECPISDKLRLAAKRACDTYWDKHKFAGVKYEYGIGICFEDAKELKSAKNENNRYIFVYDVKWLVENIDYPTILNNFTYIFEQLDICNRSNLVSIESKMGIFEKAFLSRGINDYPVNSYFNFMNAISCMQMQGYYNILSSKGIRLENVFKWFFESYLVEEFGAQGFRFNPPSENTTLVEKCRTIASEMEGVLKQFRMYVRDGEIDQELFEMSSEHIVFSNIPSFITEKYVYKNSVNAQNIEHLLLSDQSTLGYTEKTEGKYNTLIDLLANEDITIDDFAEYQQNGIEYLLKNRIIAEDSHGYLKVNPVEARLFKDLYEYEVVCSQYYRKGRSTIATWCERGDLRFETSLFSKPEQDYLNYMLNKSEFSNGLDLRNKYSHSTYPTDENVQETDYMQLLKVMILVIAKINEEFCIRSTIECTDKK